MTFTAEQNDYILNGLKNTLNAEFQTQNIQDLAEYVSDTIIDNPILNENDYILNIANPMSIIFNQVKELLTQTLNLQVSNNVYESCKKYTGQPFLAVVLAGTDGIAYWHSTCPYMVGADANSYSNMRSGFIYGDKTLDKDISVHNFNTYYGEMDVLLNPLLDVVSTTVGFRVTKQLTNYRACRKLYSNTTGIIGGVLTILLYNPVINNLPVFKPPLDIVSFV